MREGEFRCHEREHAVDLLLVDGGDDFIGQGLNVEMHAEERLGLVAALAGLVVAILPHVLVLTVEDEVQTTHPLLLAVVGPHNEERALVGVVVNDAAVRPYFPGRVVDKVARARVRTPRLVLEPHALLRRDRVVVFAVEVVEREEVRHDGVGTLHTAVVVARHGQPELFRRGRCPVGRQRLARGHLFVAAGRAHVGGGREQTRDALGRALEADASGLADGVHDAAGITRRRRDGRDLRRGQVRRSHRALHRGVQCLRRCDGALHLAGRGRACFLLQRSRDLDLECLVVVWALRLRSALGTEERGGLRHRVPGERGTDLGLLQVQTREGTEIALSLYGLLAGLAL
eukprot:PhM_4_TR1281/c0_g1_i1/m.7212